MSQKANPTLIGVFIAVALCLAVAGILIFSSSRFFTRSSEYILYFDASLTGLDTGAPVKFRGVTIGAVKQVLIHHNQQPTDSALPVLIEINEDQLNEKTDVPFAAGEHDRIKADIQRGLRARLETQSLLTGLLYVNLEFLPETPIRYHQLKPTLAEIPTAPNRIQMFMQDFAQIAEKLHGVLGKLDAGLEDFRAKELVRDLTNFVASLSALTSSPEVTNTFASAHQTFEEARLLLRDFRPQLEKLATSADRTLNDSRDALGEVRNGVRDLRDVLAPRGALRRELASALEQLAEAGRSVAALADFLNQHPNALLSGRAASESNP